jgi:hypothetical protein
MNTPTTERDLGRVEGKLDFVIQLLAGSDLRQTEQGDRHGKLIERVVALEKRVLASLCLSAAGGVSYAFDVKTLLLGMLH